MDWEYTDIHCHIIPDVDDGAVDMEASMKLVRLAHQDGIRRMIATPHCGIINPQYDPERVDRNFRKLTQEVERCFPDMKLYLGNELFLAPGFSDGLEQGISRTLAGSKYVLAEFPMDVEYEFVQREFRRLMMNGYQPIFAHVERYLHVFKSVMELERLTDQGVYLQINSNSLVIDTSRGNIMDKLWGYTRELKKREKLVQSLLKEGLVHFIATDCHDMPGRMPRMTEARKKLVEFMGEPNARRILVDNPRMILGEEKREVRGRLV